MTASEWKDLRPETAEDDVPAIFAFLKDANGFDQQVWSSLGKPLSAEKYTGRLSQKMIRVLPDTRGEYDAVAKADAWLYIGFGIRQEIRVPIFSDKHVYVTRWRIGDGKLILAVFQNEEVLFERHLTPRR